MKCEICGKEYLPQRVTKKRQTCDSNSCNAKWQYYRKLDWFRQRAKNQYWFEKENAHEKLLARNRKAKTRQRFGVDSREKLIKQNGGKCQNCGSKKFLLIHHQDHQGRNVQNLGQKPNNDIANLMILCKKCHNGHHHHNWKLKMKT